MAERRPDATRGAELHAAPTPGRGARRLPYTVLDVFADAPLQGNPVAVFTEAEGLTDAALMQALARELNLSETVFVCAKRPDGEADTTVRIFTPRLELPFAGHPVLGAAVLIGERSGLERVRLRTGAGVVPVRLRRTAGQLAQGEMEQPLPRPRALANARRVLGALGVGASRLPVELYDNGVRHAYVALACPEEVGGLAPDFAALAALGPLGVSCFCVVDGERGDAQAGGGGGRAAPAARVRLRVFAPGLGVAEDPATGSAAGPLAWHLVRHGVVAPGEWIEIKQGVELGRPSRLWACAQGSAARPERVLVAGAAVPVAEGAFLLG